MIKIYTDQQQLSQNKQIPIKMNTKKSKFILIALLFPIIFVSVYTYQSAKVLQFTTYPHEKNCYTQGLFFLNQTHLFQSCGYYDKSYYRVLKYQNNQKIFKAQETFKSAQPLDKKIFLQGATLFSQTNKIYILTWQEKKVYKINRLTFQVQQIIKWQRDGWGLTSNKTHMFATDGGATIFIIDQNFNIVDQKIITDDSNRKVYSINELQYVEKQDGTKYIYANIYLDKRIIKIDLEKGKVIKQFNMLKIIQNQKNLKGDQVINGIAYHQQSKKFILTGKNWANFYMVDLD